MGCGCNKGGSKSAGVEYEVRTKAGEVTTVADMQAVRRALTLGGGGTYKAVKKVNA